MRDLTSRRGRPAPSRLARTRACDASIVITIPTGDFAVNRAFVAIIAVFCLLEIMMTTGHLGRTTLRSKGMSKVGCCHAPCF